MSQTMKKAWTPLFGHRAAVVKVVATTHTKALVVPVITDPVEPQGQAVIPLIPQSLAEMRVEYLTMPLVAVLVILLEATPLLPNTITAPLAVRVSQAPSPAAVLSMVAAVVVEAVTSSIRFGHLVALAEEVQEAASLTHQ